MQNTSVHTILNNAKFRIFDNETPYNILSQGSVHCKSGKWQVPDDKYESLFLKNINEELVKNPNKQMHFLDLDQQKKNLKIEKTLQDVIMMNILNYLHIVLLKLLMKF